MKNYEYGITDVPHAIDDDDVLEVRKYVKGLENFIRNCPTPMSIALQGDWGTGKTTFLKTMENDFKKHKDEIKTIYFNTWQYSQFNQADKLYESLLNNIMTQLEKDDDKIKESTTRIRKDIIKLVTGAVRDVAMNYADAKTEEFTGMKISEALVKYGVTTREEQSQIICDFKDRYTSLIREFVEHSLKKSSAKDACDPRIVIFVDDLDRLNPARAVEMLEVLKLFMDVENC
ncbi:MAG: AAA family ATPase, partial [Lachnospiraceae bacterium]|nr:AAA family ATPase [Lachnospiraceae bacterium]